MTGPTPTEPLYVDLDVCFTTFERIEQGDSLSAVRAAYNRAAIQASSQNRTPVQVEVTIRVAP